MTGKIKRLEKLAMDEVASVISAGFVAGRNFIADGGMTKKMIYVE